MLGGSAFLFLLNIMLCKRTVCNVYCLFQTEQNVLLPLFMENKIVSVWMSRRWTGFRVHKTAIQTQWQINTLEFGAHIEPSRSLF